MSAGFWIRRKKLAALKRKQAETAASIETATEKKSTKTAKKGGVKKDDNAGTV